MARLIRVCPDCRSPVEMCICDDFFGDGEFAPKIEWLAKKEAELAEFVERIRNRRARSWNAEFMELINAQNVEWIAVQIHAGALLRTFD